MARKRADKSSPKKERVSLNISLSARDADTISKFALRDGGHRVAVIREAIDALREKRAYEAKRSIERPAARQIELPILERAIERSPERLVFAEPERTIRAYTPNQLADRPRVTTNLDKTTMEAFEAVAAQSAQSKAEYLRELIVGSLDTKGPTLTTATVVARKTHVVFFSKLFIAALEDALDYDPKRHHNQPPPPLRLDDDGYLDEIRSLIAELKRLNANLEAADKVKTKAVTKRTPAKQQAAEKSALVVSKHLNTFLNKYASALGTGAAALTIGTAGALLYQLGVPLDFILKHARH